jgi:hypothetical protein
MPLRNNLGDGALAFKRFLGLREFNLFEAIGDENADMQPVKCSIHLYSPCAEITMSRQDDKSSGREPCLLRRPQGGATAAQHGARIVALHKAAPD